MSFDDDMAWVPLSHTCIECSICKSIKLIIDADFHGWNWFHGFLPERFVACDKCQIAHSDHVAEKILLARPPSRPSSDD